MRTRVALTVAVVLCLIGFRALPAAATHVSVQAFLDATGVSMPGLVQPPGTGTQSMVITGTLTGTFSVAPFTAVANLQCSFTGTDVGNAGTGTGQMRGGCSGTSTSPPGWPVSLNCDITYQRLGAVTVWTGAVCTVFVNGAVDTAAVLGQFVFSAPPPYPASTFTLAGWVQVSH